MVAAAGDIGGMSPRVAVPCLVLTLIAIAATVWIGHHVKLTNLAPLPHPPAVLQDKARRMLADIGHANPPVDSAFGFGIDRDYVSHVKQTDQSANRWDALDAGTVPVIKFWYRQSPEYLGARGYLGGGGKVSLRDPPANRSGMAQVVLNASGELNSLIVVPPQVDPSVPDSTEAAAATILPDWSKLFAHARLDLGLFSPVEPEWVPPVWADTRAAWIGSDPQHAGVELRVEAAAYKGKPVYFNRIEPWTRPSRMGSKANTAGQTIANAIALGFVLTILFGSMLTARRNLQLGRGDRNGASRLALFVPITTMLTWMFDGHHVPTFYEFGLFVIASGWAFFVAAAVWLVYVALEPYLGKLWPHALISWSRLLAGRFRDPLVGRDILLGTMIGAIVGAAIHLRYIGVSWFGEPPPRRIESSFSALKGIGGGVAEILQTSAFVVFVPLGFVFLIFLLRVLLRKPWLAAIAFVLIFTTSSVARSEDRTMAAILAILSNTLIVFVLYRIGVLALVAMFFAVSLGMNMPTTYDFNAWYFRLSLLGPSFIVGLAAFGFHSALAGRRIFKDTIDDTDRAGMSA